MINCCGAADLFNNILFRPIENALQKILDEGILSAWNVQHALAGEWQIDYQCFDPGTYPILEHLKWLVPCLSKERQRVREFDFDTYGIAHKGGSDEYFVEHRWPADWHRLLAAT